MHVLYFLKKALYIPADTYTNTCLKEVFGRLKCRVHNSEKETNTMAFIPEIQHAYNYLLGYSPWATMIPGAELRE